MSRRAGGDNMKKISFILLGLVLGASTASAETYPDKSRPLKIIIPSGVGDSIDLLGRALAKAISDETGWNVFVDNKPGAEGVIGMMAAKNAAPNGYTIVLATSSSMVLAEHMLPNLPYNPAQDYTPVAGLSQGYLTVNLASNQPFSSAQELIEAARSNPGKYTIASSSTTTRLAAEMLQQMANIDMLWVPYKSAGEAMSALGGGQVDIYITDVPTAVPFHASGKARLLAVTGTSRLKAYSDIPTLAEAGVKNYNLTAWYATYLPKDTPQDIELKLRDIIRNASKSAIMQEVLEKFAMNSLDLAGEELNMLQSTDSKVWGEAVRAAGMQMH